MAKSNQARVNGGSNYDSLKVAKCLVIIHYGRCQYVIQLGVPESLRKNCARTGHKPLFSWDRTLFLSPWGGRPFARGGGRSDMGERRLPSEKWAGDSRTGHLAC
jgi:hypothetical protein